MSCRFTSTTSQAVTLDSLHLGQLAANGGPTPTVALLDGSVAIGAGLASVCAASPVNGHDQRGVIRPQGTRCDTGAYEAPAGTAGPTDPTGPTGAHTVYVVPAGSGQGCGKPFFRLDPGGRGRSPRTGARSASAPGRTSCRRRWSIAKDLSFVGDGAETTILDGGAQHRILNAMQRTISVSGLNLRNGLVTGKDSFGGAIAAKSVTVKASTFTGNSAGRGGAIWADVTVTDSTFDANSASGPYGGGAISSGTAVITNSTFVGNRAGGGGAIRAQNATVRNTTFASNIGTYGADISASGSGTVVVANSILAGPGRTTACFGVVGDGLGNLATDASCSFKATTSKVVSYDDLHLGALAANGGPTRTMPSAPGASRSTRGMTGPAREPRSAGRTSAG